MIIFGTRTRFKTLSEGEFFCPHCQTLRRYERKQGRNYFTLYFIPVIPMGDAGEFVECQSCRMMFAPDVVKGQPPKPKRDLAGMLNSLKADLAGGQPIEYVVRDLEVAGLERSVALTMVNSAIGDGRKVCLSCGLSYASSATVCTECQQPLSEK
jgi:hypothetical protein